MFIPLQVIERQLLKLLPAVNPIHHLQGSPFRVVTDINHRLGHSACIFTLTADVRTRTVRFEKVIEAKRNDYAIYQVQVTAHGFEKTEIGDIAWTFSQPVTMYTLRAAAPPLSASH